VSSRGKVGKVVGWFRLPLAAVCVPACGGITFAAPRRTLRRADTGVALYRTWLERWGRAFPLMARRPSDLPPKLTHEQQLDRWGWLSGAAAPLPVPHSRSGADWLHAHAAPECACGASEEVLTWC
jgi:hypothetical protein